MATKKSYKLIGLQIEGLRKIKAARLQFKPNGLTEIIGKNNQGKSSIIDAIEILFEGFKQKVDDIITHGSDKAVIIGELEEFTIKRVMTEKSDRLEVITKDGFKPQKPQDFLNSLINKLTFRPQVFLDKKPEEKLKSVMEILKIDFTEENRQIATKTNDRLFAGREKDNLGTRIEPEKADLDEGITSSEKVSVINDKNAEITFAFRLEFLMQILKVLQSEGRYQISMKFSENTRCFIFADYILLMPMMIDNTYF